MSNIAKAPKRKKRKPTSRPRNCFSKLAIILSLSVITFLIYKIIITNLLPLKVLGLSVNLDTSKVIALTNLERQKAGLTPLKPDEKLEKAAQEKLLDMFTYQYWDHFSPSKRPPWTFILNNGYDYAYAGENLAKDFNDDIELVQAWMGSVDHKANILGANYQDTAVAIGTGEINGQEVILVVQLFGKEYTQQDYVNAGGEPARKFSGNSPSTIENKQGGIFSLMKLSSNSQDIKLIFIFITGFSLGFLIFETINRARHHRKQILILQSLKKKYWGKV